VCSLDSEDLAFELKFFARWSNWLPAGPEFAGWIVLGLVVAGFVLGRRRPLAAIDGDPRWALLASAFLAAWFSTGPYPPAIGGVGLPDLSDRVAGLPGMEAFELLPPPSSRAHDVN
jgi:hypothetical protein